jgi:hypothetical protein
MERNVLMKKRTQARILFLLIFLCLISIHSSATNNSATTLRRLLLVCDANSTLSYLSPTETRKLFLNVPIVKDGVLLKPLLNESDPLATEVFLQNVIFLTNRSYKNKLLSRIFRYGGKNIPIYSKISELKLELHLSLEAITFMWSDQVEDDNSLKSLGVLWESSN